MVPYGCVKTTSVFACMRVCARSCAIVRLCARVCALSCAITCILSNPISLHAPARLAVDLFLMAMPEPPGQQYSMDEVAKVTASLVAMLGKTDALPTGYYEFHIDGGGADVQGYADVCGAANERALVRAPSAETRLLQ
jgi:hypothetical protein